MKTLGVTHAVCPQCRAIVPTRIEVDGDAIYHRKFCPTHGQSRSLIRRGVEDYLASLRYVKPAWEPREFAGRSDLTCPDGCGFCDRHEQHLCMPIVEVTSRCDLSCPICIVDAGEDWDMSVAEFGKLLDKILAAEGQIDVLNLSGGEPLLHPQILDLIDAAIAREQIVRVSISTHGRALIVDSGLLEELARRDVVIALQFDGFDDEAYQTMRGQAFTEQKRKILSALESADVSTSLTMTLAGGVNDGQLPAVVEYLFSHEHTISLMIQPMAFAGRGAEMTDAVNRLTIPDVVDLLAKAHPALQAEDFVPLPCSHPLCFSLSFYLRLDNGQAVSLARLIDTPAYLDSIANRGLFGLDADEFDRLRDIVYDLWSGPVGAVPDTGAILESLSSIMRQLSGGCDCFDPRKAFSVTERRINSIFIHAFQDAETFDLARVRRCCSAYPQLDGSLIPACVHNVLRRSR